MDGLLSYADIFGSWVYHLQGLWSFLNTTVNTVLGNLITSLAITSPSRVFLYALKSFLDYLGYGDLSVLMFFFTCMGYGFGFFFGFQILKWLLDLIT